MDNEPKLKIDKFGTKRWGLNSNLHRVDGPAVERADGRKEWWLNGKRHRVDGPAVEYENGEKNWYLNGKRHRVDGPAVEYADHNKRWYLHGDYYYNFDEWLTANNHISNEEKLMLKLIHG
jgi:hypothetical protein